MTGLGWDTDKNTESHKLLTALGNKEKINVFEEQLSI